MCGGPAKRLPPHGVGIVGVGAGINQNLAISIAHDEAERVRMAVTRAAAPKRSRIKKGVNGAARKHDEPGVGKMHRCRLRAPNGAVSPSALAQPPGRLLMEMRLVF